MKSLLNSFRTAYLIGALIGSLAPISADGAKAPLVRSLSVKKHIDSKVIELDLSTLSGLMKTRPGQAYSLANFDADLKQLSKLFDKIEPNISENADGLAISLHVYPKPVVQTLRWSGNKRFSDKKLTGLLGVKVSDLFDAQLFAKGINKIRAHYLKYGYYDAQVHFVARAIPLTDAVEVSLEVREGHRGYIKKITFEGMDQVEQSEFLQFLLSKPYRPIWSSITNSGRYEPELAEQDTLTLVEYLQNLGYADASGKVSIQPTKSPDFVELKFTADRGTLYRVGEISLRGNTVWSESELRKQLKLREGEPLSPARVQKTVQSLTALYGSKGYIEADVGAQIDIRDADETIQDVHFQIQEGSCCKVGLIKVRGNQITQSRVILHECLLIPGEIFDQRKLLATEQRLLNTELFKEANVYVVKSGIQPAKPDENLRDVIIEIGEGDTGRINFQVGASSNEAVAVGFGISERNFNIRGLGQIFNKGLLAIRGGGQHASLNTHFGSCNRSFDLSWTEPYWRDSPWSVGVELDHNTHRISKSHFRTKDRGAGLFATYPLNAYASFRGHYRLKHTRTVAGREASRRLREEARNSGAISAVGLGLHFDSTNSMLKATNGVISRADLEIAGLGGNFQFLRWGYTNSYYRPLLEKGTLKLRADLHFVQPFGNTDYQRLPMSERLFLGGETSIRGYRPSAVGPKFEELETDPTTLRAVLVKEEPRGGLSSLLLSAEYLHYLGNAGVGSVDGFVFVDAGTVSDRKYNLKSPWASTYGFGIRIDIGERIPLILGLGYPLQKPKDGRGDTQKFVFSIGGKF